MWQRLTDFDVNILFYVQDNLRNSFLNQVETLFTSLGNGGLLWIALVLALLIYPKTRKIGFNCMWSLLMCYIIGNLILKNVFARVRPYDDYELIRCLIRPESDYSFPSAHTSTAFTMAVTIFMRGSRKAGVFMLVFAVLMGLSRIYVCVHYPSDVIGGAILGIVCAICTCKAIDMYRNEKSKKVEKNC